MMRAGQVNKADAIAVKMGAAVIRFNSTEMALTDVIMDSKSMWAKVGKLTGRNRVDEGQVIRYYSSNIDSSLCFYLK